MPVLDKAYLLRWTPHPPNALLADGNDVTREECRAFLSKSGCVVEEAEDGRIALARALNGRIDIVIAQEHLPGIDAAHLLEILRGDRATRTLPIIVTCADESHAETLRTSGADVVLVGRPQPESLALEMQQLLTRSEQLRHRSVAESPKSQPATPRSSAMIEKALQRQPRRPMSRAHTREFSQSPALTPPTLVCPACDKPLRYEYSHTGGVNARQNEQWDYFVCSSGCGTFQFRHRTNKLRKVY